MSFAPTERLDEPVHKLYTEFHATNLPEFRTAALEAAELANTIGILQADLKAKKAELLPYLEKAGAKSVLVPYDDKAYEADPTAAPKVRLTVAKGKATRKLSTEKLLKLQVSEATIRAATTTTIGEPSLRILTSVTEAEEEAA